MKHKPLVVTYNYVCEHEWREIQNSDPKLKECVKCYDMEER